MSEQYKNILIVRTDRIGDVVLTTPAIAALRKTFHQARISILVAPATRPLVEGNLHIDEILVDDRRKNPGLLGFWKLVNQIKNRRFDLAIVFHTKKRTNSLCFLAGIPRRIGYANDKFGFLLTDKIKDERHFGKKHEAQYCLDVLAPLGVKSDALKTFVPVKEESERWVADLFKKDGLANTQRKIAVHLGASDTTKEWPAERFAELVAALQKKYSCAVIFVGGEATRQAASSILPKVQAGPVLDLTGQTSLSQLISLFKHCQLLISNDSGPVHVADAVGTPVVSIFTRNQPGINPERWRPLGSKSRVVAPKPGEVLLNQGQISSKDLQLIQTQEVLDVVDALFKLC